MLVVSRRRLSMKPSGDVNQFSGYNRYCDFLRALGIRLMGQEVMQGVNDKTTGLRNKRQDFHVGSCSSIYSSGAQVAL